MALITSKVDYALRALLDLAGQPPGTPAQSREIAGRQEIPESYLNQLLVILRRAGLVRSVRGASGGYVLGREPQRLTIADVFEALHGKDFLRDGAPAQAAKPEQVHPASFVIQNLHGRLNDSLRKEMERTTLADLLGELHKLDEAQSLMLGL